MKLKFSCFKKDKWCGKAEQSIMWVLFGIMIAIISIALFLSFDEKIINIIKALGSLMLVISLGIAANQFRLNRKQFEKNNEWNQKEAAIKALHESPKAIGESRLYLNKNLLVNPRIEKNQNFTIAEIHNELGVFLTNGCFIFHGEQTQEDIKMCRHTDTDLNKKEYIVYFDENKNGRETLNHITNLLNEYEYLAMACNLDIFDKKTVIELKGSGFIAVFNLFANHIYHMRHDVRHGGNKRLYKHFENFVIEIREELNNKEEGIVPIVITPSKRDYETPFKKC